uniref:Serpentine Receptor, class T n=1 Tax=Rhabditophanes sp. KR3021 TaxID=114890 RepID=A0AC35TFQ8_9BILA
MPINYFFNGSIINNYYDCSFKPYQLHESMKRPNLSVGIVYIILSLVFIIIYLPFLLAMRRNVFMKHSYYKLQFMIGCINVIFLVVHGICSGVLALEGSFYCVQPELIFVLGSVSVGLWGAYSITIIILAFNRCLSIYDGQLTYQMFGKKKAWYWMSGPVLYFIGLTAFTHPLIFSTKHKTWLFNPFTEYPKIKTGLESDINVVFLFNNYAVIVSITFIYGFFYIIGVMKRSIRHEKATKETSYSRQSFNQTALMALILTSSCFFLLFTHFQHHHQLYVTHEIVFICSNGLPSILFHFFAKQLKSKFSTLITYNPKVKLITLSSNFKVKTIA